MASVSSGLRCMARLSLPTMTLSRWYGVPPASDGAVGLGVDALELPAQGRHQQVHLRTGSSGTGVPTATSARSATARIWTAS